ncbi:MAG TPA: SGNH/GDSL hydrolase family protein [Candidatus Saccharimonadales bacterium]|nr:SGNH/GDSL hydrolase family protein [Candidatus Saccharimonadales bacterium]
MNTHPDAVTVLCYGDSNTWGQRPEKKGGRFPSNVRWPGKLQDILGDDYYVIEEGLNSRTTDLEYYKKPGRNGKTYLIPCIESHRPIGIVAIMLGTNDLKTTFGRSATDVAEALRGLVRDVRETAVDKEGKIPRIILISPILIDDTAELFSMFYAENYSHEAVMKSQDLAGEIQKVANEEACFFIDAASVAEPGVDGIHFKKESHPALATLVAKTISAP